MKQKKQPKEQPHTQDVLEAYPEHKQVDAFSERRYIKMMRFLTIFTIINLAMIMAGSGLYFYLAKNADISVSSRNMYAIDPEKKLLLPSESKTIVISAKQLLIEQVVRDYLYLRYAVVLDNQTMKKRWGENGIMAFYSAPGVFEQFKTEVEQRWNETIGRGVTRDLHIYDLSLVRGDLWSAYIETFDFKVDENLGRICDCDDNSRFCITCKEMSSIPGSRKRHKIWLRADAIAPKTQVNPMGIVIYAYYPSDIPVPKKGEEKSTFWDLPPALRPDI